MNAMRVFLFTLGTCLLAALAMRLHGAPPQEKTAVDAGGTSRGQTLFAGRCAICHYDRSEAQKMGPGLKGIYARGKFADGKKVDDAGMTAWIQDGGKDMPPMKDTLQPDEIRALVAYLKTL
jgi:cytochrome c